jgi:hypothetical protein
VSTASILTIRGLLECRFGQSMDERRQLLAMRLDAD